MDAREFVLGMNELSKLDVAREAAVRVRCAEVLLLGHRQPRDHTSNTGDAVPFGGGEAAITATCEPALLGLYRQDPVALREQVTRWSHRARNEGIRALFARLFC